MNHRTVKPPTEEEQEASQCEIALETLRSLDEEWEYVVDTDKRRSIRHAIAVLENE